MQTAPPSAPSSAPSQQYFPKVPQMPGPGAPAPRPSAPRPASQLAHLFTASSGFWFELGLTALFQVVMLFDVWMLFYLFYFANYMQCSVSVNARKPMYNPDSNPPSFSSEVEAPSPASTARNTALQVQWYILAGILNAVLIGALVYASRSGLLMHHFLTRNAIIFAIVGILEAAFFFFVGWTDFPVAEGEGVQQYLQALVQDIQQQKNSASGGGGSSPALAETNASSNIVPAPGGSSPLLPPPLPVPGDVTTPVMSS